MGDAEPGAGIAETSTRGCEASAELLVCERQRRTDGSRKDRRPSPGHESAAINPLCRLHVDRAEHRVLSLVRASMIRPSCSYAGDGAGIGGRARS